MTTILELAAINLPIVTGAVWALIRNDRHLTRHAQADRQEQQR